MTIGIANVKTMPPRILEEIVRVTMVLNRPLMIYLMIHLETLDFFTPFQGFHGTTDGTHIPIIVAQKNKIKYTNMKGYTRQNVLTVYNFDMRFTFIVPGWPSSVHYTLVLTDAQQNFSNFPHPLPDNPFIVLFLIIFSMNAGKYYFIDSRYIQTEWVTLPYS
jgi:hypothetical protein